MGWCTMLDRYPGPRPSASICQVVPPSFVTARLPSLSSGTSQFPPMAHPWRAFRKVAENTPVMLEPCTTGKSMDVQVLPASTDRRHRDARPPVKIHTVSPWHARLPLDAANAASPSHGVGSKSHGTRSQCAPPSWVVNIVKQPSVASPNTNARFPSIQTMASKNMALSVLW